MVKKLLLCGVVVALLCSTAMAAAIDYRQGWEGYTPSAGGVHDPDYVAEWPVIGTDQRFNISTDSPAMGSNGLKIAESKRYGITHDLHDVDTGADAGSYALDAGEVVVGTDDDMLLAHFQLDVKLNDYLDADHFMEVGLDGAHAPDPDGSGAANVLAFGITNGGPRVFDGLNWQVATNIHANYKRWHYYMLEIRTDTITLISDSGKREDGGVYPRVESQVFDREYLGGFDTVSARTILNTERNRYSDKHYLQGGDIVPEPATLSFLALGGLALLRRRR